MKKYREEEITKAEGYSSSPSVYRGSPRRGREFLDIVKKTPPALRATSSINRGGAKLLFGFGNFFNLSI